MSFDFRAVPLAELAARVRRREIAARELVDHALERIEALNGSVNAFVAVDAAEARAAAAAIDERLANGADCGPLAGIPIGVKDLEDATGFVTSGGSAFGAAGPVATRDSSQVARLRAAGCVVVGKTNSPEFGLKAETDNPTFGVTRNPWDLTRTPGGSSGGTSAALAAGMVPLATGSDGGGSIRIPSAVTGLTGLKPTQGWVPAGDPGPVGWQDLSTRGPMARRAADVAYALDVVIGPDPNDFRSLPRPAASWYDAARAPVRPTRVAWSPTLGYATVDGEVRAMCEAVVAALDADGVEVVQLDTVFSEGPSGAIGTLVSTYTRRTVEPLRGTEWWDRIDTMTLLSAELARLTTSDPLAVVQAEDACHRFNLELQRALDGVDVLLCPVTMAVAPGCENPSTVDALLAVAGDVAVIEAVTNLGLDAGELDALFDQLRAREPFNLPMGTIDGEPTFLWHGMTQAFNMTRAPAGTVCAGLSSLGVPVGLQVVGHRLDDARVLSILAHLEEVVAFDAVAPI